jgi:hypothetical protein
MNYIKHLNKIMEMFYSDQRINSNHISIYLALFKHCNDNRFENPFPINRQEIMQASKITSFSTYTKCLQQLHGWGFLEYKTSNNPNMGTQIKLHDLSNSSDKSSSNTSSNSSSNSSGNSSGNSISNTLPYIDNLNITKIVKEIPPTIEQVIEFFLTEKFPEKEAQKFFNHFQSNGWKVGGKSPMQDWQAAARNWMLNSDKFKANGNKSKSFHSEPNKDYSEPL